MKNQNILVTVIALGLLLLALTVVPSLAQGPGDDIRPQGEVGVTAVSDYIPIQGQLTDSGGSPLDGDYSITFRLYDVYTGGTALCEDSNTVDVDNGLFSTYMKADSCPIDGRQLYLSVQVGSDPEMTPRQYVDNVPYAWSLRPGAEINGSIDSSDVLYVKNNGTGPAISGQSVTASTDGIGVRGTSMDGSGVKGTALTGIGVQGDSFAGVAIKATGTGIIQSTADSYVWISGNGVRPYHQDDSTIIDMNTIGGARIYRGAAAGYKNVMLPIVIPGQLYGQDVTVSALDIYWVGDTEFEAITAVLLRRQTGVCETSSCYATILHDTVDHACWEYDNPTGCSLHYNLSSNNVLSSSSGILYLTLELGFSGASAWLDIGGVRLTLAHE
jgi:hypothetical protein